MSTPEPEPAPQNPWTKLAIELGPLLAFFITQRAKDLFWATGVFMVATVVSVVASRKLEKRWPTMPLVTGVFVMVMGGLTLALQDDTFIKLKPTLTNLLFAAILLGGMLKGRLFLKLVFGEAFQLDEPGWGKLTVRFGLYFVFLAALNEIVVRTQSEDTWVTFKVFGVLPLTLAFTAAQTPLLKRHALVPEGAEAAEGAIRCPHCGAGVPDAGAATCVHCGAPLRT